MKAASLPSGDSSLFGTAAGRSVDVHCVPCTSQVQCFRSLSNENDWRSAAR